MGPWGAGKEAVLHFDGEAIGPDHRVAFAHRYITRPTDPGGENHVALSPAEFGTRRAAGLFAFDWQAHGISYGIGVEIEAWRKAGLVVGVNGTRWPFPTLDPTALGIVPGLIPAPAS